MSRYAILCDLDTPNLDRIGRVTEQPNGVRIKWERDIGLKSWRDDPLPRIGPLGDPIVIEPGDPAYFDEIVYALSRTFLVSETGDDPSVGPAERETA